eukprot:CAMPEP_0172585188 /NCGR_PEP_ID=MMETSP1068-20121228/4619_1 /TAXON_ID=35684 /ORGANISM="Pseudopedinella elastica, Strain CCMP716" /LENGTH=63 /DNA_ID=CAMNT_0013379555 /DNA_START=90 /DNA_END=281 /DNA_ORIENTATION=+
MDRIIGSNLDGRDLTVEPENSTAHASSSTGSPVSPTRSMSAQLEARSSPKQVTSRVELYAPKC